MITEIYYDNWKWSLYCMLLLGQYTAITEIWTVFKGWCYLTEVTSDPKSKVKTACNYPGDLLEYNQLLCKIQDNINVRSCPRVFVLQSGSSVSTWFTDNIVLWVEPNRKILWSRSHCIQQNDDWQQAVYFRCGYLLLLKFYSLNQVKKSHGEEQSCPDFLSCPSI